MSKSLGGNRLILIVNPLELMIDIHIATSFDAAAKAGHLHGIPLEEQALLFGDLDFFKRSSVDPANGELLV